MKVWVKFTPFHIQYIQYESGNKKQIENLIKASELYETIEVIQDCLSHFEELDYLQKYNLKIPDIKKSLSQDCQCEDDCFCPSIFLDTVDVSGEIELSDYARSLVGVVDFDQRFEEGEMSDFLKLRFHFCGI